MSDRSETEGRLLLVGEVHRRPERRLSVAGFDTQHAPDLLDALDRLDTERVDGIVLGDTDRASSTLAARLRAAGHGQPMVALVDGALPETTRITAVAPADDPDAVVRHVRSVVDDDRLERARAARHRQEAAVEAAETAALETPDEWADALCRSLVSSPEYAVAWVGRYDEDTGHLDPVAAAGIPRAHLDRVAVRPDEESASSWAVETGAVATGSHDAGTLVAVPLDEPPAAVLHLVCRRANGLSRGERHLLASLGEALSPVFAAEGPPDAVAVLGDALAHELGNQLDIATTHLELAREREDASHFEHVESALDRMTALAADARRLARGGVETELVTLASAAAEAWAAVETTDASLDADSGTVTADPGLLGLLLENVFRNAVEHGGPAVSVRVSATDDGFAVADDGPGIDPAARDRVLEWGYSTDGTGVGLGIVALIAERHGWAVEVTESDTGGARFVFS